MDFFFWILGRGEGNRNFSRSGNLGRLLLSFAWQHRWAWAALPLKRCVKPTNFENEQIPSAAATSVFTVHFPSLSCSSTKVFYQRCPGKAKSNDSQVGPGSFNHNSELIWKRTACDRAFRVSQARKISNKFQRWSTFDIFQICDIPSLCAFYYIRNKKQEGDITLFR